MQKSTNFVQALFFTTMSSSQRKKKHALSFQHTETVSTGLLDFHKLVLIVLKSKPREIHYRNYKKFDSLKFNVDLKNAFDHALNLTKYL